MRVVNRRIYYRMRIRLQQARAMYLHGGRAKSCWVEVLDLSGSGAQIRSTQPLTAGDLLRMTLPPWRGSGPLEVNARVVWVRRLSLAWEAGVEFLRLPEATRDLIVQRVFAEELRRRRARGDARGEAPVVKRDG